MKVVPPTPKCKVIFVRYSPYLKYMQCKAYPSIGLIIKGIALSPTNVVTHIWARGGIVLAILPSVNLDAAQILLIVKPGMITEARPCQMAASTEVSTAFLFWR